MAWITLRLNFLPRNVPDSQGPGLVCVLFNQVTIWV